MIMLTLWAATAKNVVFLLFTGRTLKATLYQMKTRLQYLIFVYLLQLRLLLFIQELRWLQTISFWMTLLDRENSRLATNMRQERQARNAVSATALFLGFFCSGSPVSRSRPFVLPPPSTAEERQHVTPPSSAPVSFPYGIAMVAVVVVVGGPATSSHSILIYCFSFNTSPPSPSPLLNIQKILRPPKAC
jgi:hypothetical protein